MIEKENRNINPNELSEYHYDVIDNSRMFSHWCSAKGRIGKLEYGLTLALCVIIYSILLMGGIKLGEALNYPPTSTYYTIVHIVCIVFMLTFMILAAIKRIHDAGKPVEKVMGPIIVLIGITLIRGGKLIVLFIATVLSLFFIIFYKSEEGDNKYGSQPSNNLNLMYKHFIVIVFSLLSLSNQMSCAQSGSVGNNPHRMTLHHY